MRYGLLELLEWPREGSLKQPMALVDADGNPARYQRGAYVSM